MQTISDAHLAILRDKFQAAASGFHALAKLERVRRPRTAPGDTANQSLAGTMYNYPAPGLDLTWINATAANDANAATAALMEARVLEGGNTYHAFLVCDLGEDVTTDHFVVAGGGGPAATEEIDWTFSWSDDGSTWTPIDITSRTDVFPGVTAGHDNTVHFDSITHRYFRLEYIVLPVGLQYQQDLRVYEWQIIGSREAEIPGEIEVLVLRPLRVSIERSRRLGADQAELEFANDPSTIVDRYTVPMD